VVQQDTGKILIRRELRFLYSGKSFGISPQFCDFPAKS
jgi:hypothetical protein